MIVHRQFDAACIEGVVRDCGISRDEARAAYPISAFTQRWIDSLRECARHGERPNYNVGQSIDRIIADGPGLRHELRRAADQFERDNVPEKHARFLDYLSHDWFGIDRLAGLHVIVAAMRLRTHRV